jgi:uncharacterized OB-fold protein
MTWEPRPLPYVTGETERYWEAASEGTLVYRECNECGLKFHYPRALCPDCLSDDVDWEEAAGTGEVYTYTLMHQLSGWPDEDLPLVVAYVELDEGPRMMTNVVDVDAEDVSIGDRVQVKFVETEEETVAIPVFEPAE